MSQMSLDHDCKKLSYQLLFLILSLILMMGDTSFALCKMSRDPKFNYFASFEANAIGTFGEGSNLNFAPSTIERCQQDAGQFLMISLGVRRTNLFSDTADISFDGKITDAQCKIKNSFLKNAPDFAESQNFLSEQYKALRSCTYLEIYDLGGKPLVFNNQQAHCTLTTLPGNIVKAEGDYCFFRIQPNNRFAIGTVIRPECKDEAFLKANHINPQDIEASLNTYIVGDDTGTSEDVNPIGSSRVRLYIAPSTQQLALTEENGPENPRFPTEYTAEIHMGEFKLRGSLGNYVSDLSLLVDNRSPRVCKNGFCTSPSDFDLPVVGEAELQQLNPNGTHTFIDSWWHAGIAPARWQGLMKSAQHNLNEVEFKPGTRYSLTVTFVDPYEDFSLFLKGMEQLLIDLRGMQGTAGIDSIMPIPSLTELVGLPPLESLPALRSPDMSAEMDRILETMNKLGQDRQWPSYYDHVCDSTRATCIRSGKAKYFLKLTTEFTVAGIDEQNSQVLLKDITVTRESPQFENYRKAIQEFPKVVCGEDAP
jgi:hypothetical protein